MLSDNSMTLIRGTRLGPYEIETPLGAGGMGEVYRARDTRLDRAVAIKVIRSRETPTPVVRERFQHEARAIAQLSHPSICTLYDVGHLDGTDFLVMEYLEGETLDTRISRQKLRSPRGEVPSRAIFTDILEFRARVLVLQASHGAATGERRRSRTPFCPLTRATARSTAPGQSAPDAPRSRCRRRSAVGGHAAALIDGHVSQAADRLASTRARRAAAARDVRSPGTASPVPKYISSGVCPRNAECGSTRLCSWT